jgi:hypothetical protein
MSLADAIERDLLKERTPSPASAACFVCGRQFGHGDGRFCSTRCRTACGAGMPPFTGPVDAAYGLPQRGDGFAIECAGCCKAFISRGLRCCSTQCESAYRERIEVAAIVQEVGGELPAKRKCAECGGDIPRYRGVGKARREVKKTTRFCSDKCAKRARRHCDSQTGVCPPKATKSPCAAAVP